MTTAAR